MQGRMYDGHVLDLPEFCVSNLIEIQDIEGFKKMSGAKPMLVFQGDQWDTDSVYGRLQNLFIDFFRGDKVSKVSLKGLDHVLTFHIIDGVILIRGYFTRLVRSGTKVRVQLIYILQCLYYLTICCYRL